jgi:hypothetical protein
MAKYRVQKQFFQWDETIVEADSLEEAFDYAQENWQDLPVEGVGDYEPTGTWLVVDDNKGEETSIYA